MCTFLNLLSLDLRRIILPVKKIPRAYCIFATIITKYIFFKTVVRIFYRVTVYKVLTIQRFVKVV